LCCIIQGYPVIVDDIHWKVLVILEPVLALVMLFKGVLLELFSHFTGANSLTSIFGRMQLVGNVWNIYLYRQLNAWHGWRDLLVKTYSSKG